MLQTRRSGDLSQEEQKKVSEFHGFWNREERFRRFYGWLEALKTHDDGTVSHMTGCTGVKCWLTHMTLKKAEQVGKGRASGVTPRSSDKLSVKDVSEVCHGVVLLHGV